MVRVTISRRDTADTAITAELLLSLHVQSFSLSPVTEVDWSGDGMMGTEVDWSGGGMMGTEVEDWSGGDVAEAEIQSIHVALS